MVDEVPVLRAFDMPVARDRSVEGITEPVDDQPEARKPKEPGGQVARPVSAEGHEGADDADQREGVGSEPVRQVFGEPAQRRSLERTEKDVIDTFVLLFVAHAASSGGSGHTGRNMDHCSGCALIATSTWSNVLRQRMSGLWSWSRGSSNSPTRTW